MSQRYNEIFIELLDKLSNIMLKRGEPFRARAYNKAQETIMNMGEDITSLEQLRGKPNIGTTIMEKLTEYVSTGTLKILEEEKNNPINMLSDVYGIGPKKAQELVSQGITTIAELRKHQNELLNDTQIVGLKYYEQILERIPRSEIDEYEKIFKHYFNPLLDQDPNAKFEIVGSYRRGAQSSGDIDVVITGSSLTIYKKLMDVLIKSNIIIEVLTRGNSKTFVIAKLNNNPKCIARRIDFLFAPIDEYAFAILYFTGSKIFNTVMRQYALDKGYTFNEHGIYKMENKEKGEKITNVKFQMEKDIFDFLGLQFKMPADRRDGRDVITSVPQINNKISNFVSMFKLHGIKLLDKMDESQLSNIITYASEQYFNETPVLTDSQFDIIKEYVENKYPNNEAVKEIGTKIISNKVKLPFYMPSMNKIKQDDKELKKWLKKYDKNQKITSWKLDGISGLYCTTESNNIKLYTRGDSEDGGKKDHLVKYFNFPYIPNVAIRGEFIVNKNVFKEKYASEWSNPRNMVAGIINRKPENIGDEINDIHFVAYEVIYPPLKPTEQLQFLTTHGFEVVPNIIIDKHKLNNQLLSDLLVEWRKNCKYEIDGIICTDDGIYERTAENPKHAFAFKMVLTDQIVEAKVVDVLWTPSKDALIKPRVQIEPVELSGVIIEFATGFNAKFIKDNKIGVGAIVRIYRSGEVIPHIDGVPLPADEPKMPDGDYVWTESGVDIMLKNPEDDPVVKEKNITGFFTGIGVEGLSSGNIKRLINAGYDSVAKILKMDECDFLKVDGFKNKMANKIYTGIANKLKSANIITLMASSNIFGHGFSEKRLKMIMDELPYILVSDISNEDKITAIEDIRGMARKTAEAFVSKIADFKQFLIDCDLEDMLYMTDNNTDNSVTHELNGKTIVLTGTRDKTIIDFLKSVGANQGSSVSKNTHMVIAKDLNDDTGKVETAKKLGIELISVTDFITKYVK